MQDDEAGVAGDDDGRRAEPVLRRATLADVAALAGVSMSAVSRSFTAGASVSTRTRAKVLKAAEALSFRPNILAQSLMTGRSGMIALVTNALANPFGNAFVARFTAEIQTSQRRPLVFNLSREQETQDTVMQIAQYQVDGILIASSSLSDSFRAALGQLDIPTVMIFDPRSTNDRSDCIDLDNAAAGRSAAKTLLECGYSRPGFIGPIGVSHAARERHDGFVTTLRGEGRDCATVPTGEFSHEAGYAAVPRLFAADPACDAIFCADDLLALGAIDAIRKVLGRDVPQIGVIGFNDIPIAAWPGYELTTFRVGVAEIVCAALNRLDARMREPAMPATIMVMDLDFVPRQSIARQTG